MFGPRTGLFGARHCQCWRANIGPAPGSPTAPRSICVTSATEASAVGSRAKAVLLGGRLVSRLPGVVGSLVCADAAAQDAESLAENSACSLVQALTIQYHYLAAAYRHYVAGNKPAENLIRCGTSSS